MNAIANTIRTIFDAVTGIWTSEPVAVTGLVTVLLDAAISFGAPISPDQKTAVIGVVSALGILVARSKVSPVTTP
jgi:hypothetical protein